MATGFVELDNITGGFQKSDMIVLAARPGMGKTAFVLTMARNITVEYNVPVAVFSLEMSAVQLVQRLISAETEISSDKFRKGSLAPHEYTQLHERIGKLSEAPLYIDDTPALSIFELRAKCRRLKSTAGIEMVVIDYLQLMEGSTPDNRVQEISEITRGLKGIAKELDVPVIALSQLSRQVENREDKRPQLADLRESGSIEQDADVVMFIYREAYYEQSKIPIKRGDEDEGSFQARMSDWQDHMSNIHNQALVIISKNRHGPTGDVKLFFDGSTTRFSDYIDEDRFAGSPGY